MEIQWTLGTILLDAQWSQLLVRYSAYMSDPSLSDETTALVTYSGRTHEKSKLSKAIVWFFLAIWLHRVYIIVSDIVIDLNLLHRFWQTAASAEQAARESYLVGESEGFTRY